MSNNHEVPRDVRNVMLRKYNNTCQECGRRFNDSSKLHVHHKSYNEKKEKYLKNYELLCARCHRIRHNLIDSPSKPSYLFSSDRFGDEEDLSKDPEGYDIKNPLRGLR